MFACPRPTLPSGDLPSRAHDADAQGFYAQPAGLADDFPEETATAEKIRRDFATAHAAGARFLRFGIGWDGVEVAPGRYDWRLWDRVFNAARDNGITPLPYVCYTPKWLNPDPKDYWRKPPDEPSRFGAFLEAISRRYPSPSWELWNEPDNDQYWQGSVAQFIELVRVGAAGVRRGNPRAKVVLGGMSKGWSPFLDASLRGTADAIDVVNLHGYLETWDERRAEDYPRYIGEVAEQVARLAPRADLWLAEFGYSDWRLPDGRPSEWSYAVDDWEHTREFQAIALLRAHALALGTGVLSLTTWYRIDDLVASEPVIGDENNKHLGVLDAAGNPKPALAALSLWNRLLSDPVRPVRAGGGGDAVVRAFEKRSGELVVFAWPPSARRADPPRTLDAIVPLSLPRAVAALHVYDPVTGERTSTVSPARVHLRADSIFVGVADP